MRRRWGWLAAEAAILAVAAAVKALAIAQLGDHPLLQPAGGLDSEWYVALASRVAAGDWTLAGAFEGGAFPISPLYVYVLAIVLGLSGGSLLAARVVQAALGVVAIACAMRCARDWFGDAAGLVAGVLLAGAGVITFHEIVLLQSALDPVLIAALALVYGRAIQGDRWPAWAGAGLLAALFALNRPNALIVAAAIGAGLLARLLLAAAAPGGARRGGVRRRRGDRPGAGRAAQPGGDRPADADLLARRPELLHRQPRRRRRHL